MDIGPIDDIPLVDVTNENYILDLETEIDVLKAQNNILKLELKLKPKQQDKSCCEAYNILVSNFHKLLDELTPF